MTKKLLILGSGFGLYGYLPAAILAGWSVSTLARYEQKIIDRVELRAFLPKVNLISEYESRAENFQAVAIARTPTQQIELLKDLSSYNGHFYLEKPLGKDAQCHSETLKLLAASHQSFSVGYLFRFQNWYQELIKTSSVDYNVSIEWEVSRSSVSTWKGFAGLGGGLLSYYGVHLLTLLVDLGFDSSSLSFDISWESLIVQSTIPEKKLILTLKYSDSPHFRVKIAGKVWALASPFGTNPVAGIPDPRVPALTAYLKQASDKFEFEAQISHEHKVMELRELLERLL